MGAQRDQKSLARNPAVRKPHRGERQRRARMQLHGGRARNRQVPHCQQMVVIIAEVRGLLEIWQVSEDGNGAEDGEVFEEGDDGVGYDEDDYGVAK